MAAPLMPPMAAPAAGLCAASLGTDAAKLTKYARDVVGNIELVDRAPGALTKHLNDPNVQKLIQTFQDPKIAEYLKTTDDQLIRNTLGPIA